MQRKRSNDAKNPSAHRMNPMWNVVNEPIHPFAEHVLSAYLEQCTSRWLGLLFLPFGAHWVSITAPGKTRWELKRTHHGLFPAGLTFPKQRENENLCLGTRCFL